LFLPSKSLCAKYGVTAFVFYKTSDGKVNLQYTEGKRSRL
jgi:hypothetical protein